MLHFQTMVFETKTFFDKCFICKETFSTGKDGYRKLTQLRYQYPGLKVSLAIGGWNEGSSNYSEMARNPHFRRIFVNSVVDFLR